MKILLKLMFNGANYCGFQSQPNRRAVQNILTDTFSDLLGFPCAITGCSRTDSGVHALSFCAALSPHTNAFSADWCSIPVGKLHRAVNCRLPDDIAVTGAAYVPDDFHPRYDAVKKEYVYRIYDAPARDPFLAGRAYHTSRIFGEDAVRRMNEAATMFVGEHCFAGFMSAGSKITDSTRHVYSAEIFRGSDGLLSYRVEANGFLYNMVRIMIGTLLEIGWGMRNADDLLSALHTGDRTKAGFTAPPEGLYLSHVTYNREIQWLCN